jgi:AsmA family protein
VSKKRAGAVILGLLGAVVALGAAAIVLLSTMDPRPLVEGYASKSFGRHVSIGALRIGWGDPLTVELRDLRIANAPWGSEPDMVRVESLSAEIDLWSLLSGFLRIPKLEIVKPSIILERDAEGGGNWRFNRSGPLAPSRSAIVPRNRAQVPTLIDFRLRDGRIGYRTSSGAILRGVMHELTIRSGGDDDAIALALDGAYNDTAARVTAEMQSFAALRNGSVPFGMVLSVATTSSTVDFNGTMTEPFDFDGVQGSLRIDGRDLGGFLKIFDAEIAAAFPVSVVGMLHRTGDNWQLSDAKGKLATNGFIGTFALLEAGRATPDDVALTLNFSRLDLNQLLKGDGTANTSGAATLGAQSLRLDGKRATNIDATIKAAQLDYGAIHVGDVALHGTIVTGRIALSQLNFVVASGTFDGSGVAQTVANGTHVTGTAGFSGIDAGRLSESLGAEAGQFAGKLDGGLMFEMTGETVKGALKASGGHAALAMTQGSVARALLERASTDLRSLFRKDEGAARIGCLLAVIDLRNGVGTISPLRLQTQNTTLIGGGRVDLLGDRLDVTIKSEAASTGFFALDVPFRVSGNFAALGVQPVIASSTAWLDAPARNNPAHELPPRLQPLAERNPCLR